MIEAERYAALRALYLTLLARTGDAAHCEKRIAESDGIDGKSQAV